MKDFFNCIVTLLCCFMPIQSIEISRCAKWNKQGITAIGTGMTGNSSKEFNEPIGISIHEPSNSLFIADHRNARIQKFLLNQLSGNGITVVNNLLFPLHIYVDDDNNEPAIYVTLSVDSRIEKWRLGASKGIQIGENCNDCVGVAVDKAKNVYITDTFRSRIIKWSPQTNQTLTVAGTTDQSGSAAELLASPQGLYVTQNGDHIYAVDSANNRIQKWSKNAQRGITVAGSKDGAMGNDSASLNNPISVLVDEKTNVIYVADTFNHRITRWLPDAIHGDIIAGLGGQGDGSDQLNQPTDFTFDSDGNLYVTDLKNNRIQLFRLIENNVCSSSEPVATRLHKMISYLVNIWIVAKLVSY